MSSTDMPYHRRAQTENCSVVVDVASLLLSYGFAMRFAVLRDVLCVPGGYVIFRWDGVCGCGRVLRVLRHTDTDADADAHVHTGGRVLEHRWLLPVRVFRWV
eukprot:2496998-Rhodomonas_salina.1